jgi:hypothetical protein
MAHISDLRAGIFTYLDIYTGTVADTVDTATEYAALFTSANSADITRMPSVREFPSIGTPANIVNVPVYGQSTSSQVQGQSDAPTLEITVNYIPDDMLDIHNLIGQEAAFRFMMCAASTDLNGSLAATLATDNTEFYFKGKIEAILVNPALTDATTATVTLSAQSDFFGPDTIPAA